ncbi:hypothetical protein PIB30_046813 [Stylosanthes scabra]|uniref:Ubiquitin-like protease family profile domain-containing protein n=1 Tax=Stylosanthes scabra TaxID=79078 RepID=A0ABU6SGF0_9FABA|nr:hypothetical protein [Stylosanthes scabra]
MRSRNVRVNKRCHRVCNQIKIPSTRLGSFSLGVESWLSDERAGARSALTPELTFDRAVARVRRAAAQCGQNPPERLPGHRVIARCPVSSIFGFLLSIFAFHVLPSLPYAFLHPYKGGRDQFQTSQPTKSLENHHKDLDDKVVTWATVPKGGNEFETIFKLSGDRFLETMRYQFTSMRPRTYIDIQVRMFEMHGHNWMDNEKNKPHDIATLVNHREYMMYLDKDKLLTHRFLFAPIPCSEHWWLYVLDVEKKDFFILDSKNIVSPSDERSTMNRFASNILDQIRIWAGAPTIFNEGSCSLLRRYINIPGQPNETDYGVFVMKWMELINPTVLADCCEADKEYNIEKWAEPKLDEFSKQIVAKIMLRKDNEKIMQTIRQVNEMRNIKPAAVLRSPYVQVSSADLYSK